MTQGRPRLIPGPGPAQPCSASILSPGRALGAPCAPPGAGWSQPRLLHQRKSCFPASTLEALRRTLRGDPPPPTDPCGWGLAAYGLLVPQSLAPSTPGVGDRAPPGLHELGGWGPGGPQTKLGVLPAEGTGTDRHKTCPRVAVPWASVRPVSVLSILGHLLCPGQAARWLRWSPTLVFLSRAG